MCVEYWQSDGCWGSRIRYIREGHDEESQETGRVARSIAPVSKEDPVSKTPVFPNLECNLGAGFETGVAERP